jgi:iron complex transport system substrate-binding protein
MGLGDKIVGVTNFCDYPEDSKTKPKVGGIYNPSLEAVVSLRPDVVVMTTDGNLKEFEERLRSLGIRTYVFEARRLFELSDEIRRLGGTLGFTEKTDVLAKDIEEAFNRYKALGSKQKGKRVLFIVWPEPLIVAGSGTAIDDAISLLGCENIASKANTSYPKYSVEGIIRHAPEVIFIGKGHADVKAASRSIIEKLSGVPAVKHGEVYYISDSIYRLSPGIIKGIDEMEKCLK